jgi:fused signal recognition particle receptor
MLGWFKKKLKRGDEKTPVNDENKKSSSSVSELPSEDKLEKKNEGAALSVPTKINGEEKVPESDIPPPLPPPLPVGKETVVSKPDLEESTLVPDKSGPEKENEALSESEDETNRKGLFSKLKDRLSKTRDVFVFRMDELFLGKKEIDTQLLDELEEIMIMADLGVGTTSELLDFARAKVKRKELAEPMALKVALKEKISSYILSSDRPAELVLPETGPFVIMVVGVNGVGKTTTIGKIANKFVKSGQSVMLVAADTFRAAAVEQLKIWGERNNVEVMSQSLGADPSSVVYDALESVKKRPVDVVIIDTAGRIHTKVNLMEELKKIKRVAGKKIQGAPHEVMLVLDATTGQNGISQTRLFNEAVEVTGLTLTKLDGTAKGGIIVNICHDFNIPIRFIGIGEQIEDLRDFDSEEFIEALFGKKEK